MFAYMAFSFSSCIAVARTITESMPVSTSMKDLFHDVFRVSNEKKDPKIVKVNRGYTLRLNSRRTKDIHLHKVCLHTRLVLFGPAGKRGTTMALILVVVSESWQVELSLLKSLTRQWGDVQRSNKSGLT